MDVLFPSRAGVVNEGNNGNKHPPGPPYFLYFPHFWGTREAEIRRPEHTTLALSS